MRSFKSIAIIATLLFVCLSINLLAQDAMEWRGPGRTGVFEETGLLKTWPDGGPDLLWQTDSLPSGYSSVSIAEEMIYLTGIQDSMDVLIALGKQGDLLWQSPYGRAWEDSYNHSKCTPTINDGKVYVSSGLGDVACLNARSGEIIWKVKANEKYDGAFGKWGISESLILHKNLVFYTPGGSKTTTIALDKNTGEEVWVSESLNDNPSFTSPLIFEWENKKTFVNATQNYIYALNPENGDILWTFDFGKYAGGEWKRNNQTNTPVFDNGKLFITSGYDHKCVQLQLLSGQKGVSINWIDSTLDVHHGGVVKIDDYLYGASWEGNRDGKWVCLEWSTGKVMYEAEWENKGAIVAADGMLYCYEEKNGHIALVRATPEKFDLVSSFKIEGGKGPHWSHPVIFEKRLYVRHGNSLMAYSIEE